MITTSSNDSGTETCWRTLRIVRCGTVLHATPSTHLASWRTRVKLQKSAHTAPHTHATRSLLSKVCCSLQKPTHRFTLESLMNFTEHKNFEIHRTVLMSCNTATSTMCRSFFAHDVGLRAWLDDSETTPSMWIRHVVLKEKQSSRTSFTIVTGTVFRLVLLNFLSSITR